MLWRRFLVCAESTLADLHCILQVGFGWTDFHLHRFRIRKKSDTVPRIGMMKGHDARTVRLADLKFRMNERFLYEYDFGDAWLHEVRIEQRLPLDPKQTYSVCIDGQHASPPDDCGGTQMYLQMRVGLTYRAWFGSHGREHDFNDEDDRGVEGVSADQPVDPDDFSRRKGNARLRQYASVDREGCFQTERRPL